MSSYEVSEIKSKINEAMLKAATLDHPDTPAGALLDFKTRLYEEFSIE